MKSFYDRYVMPRLVDLACASADVRKQRKKVVPEAEGVVLEVGIGGGRNLALYDRSKVKRVIGLDPDAGMLERGRERFHDTDLDLKVLSAGAEDIPLEDAEVDTAVATFVLCTIPEIERSLAEIRRVLKPGGRVLFAEHGRSTEPAVARWQDRLDKPWGWLAGGCHLNRDPARLLADAGFRIESLDMGYDAVGPRFATFLYVGSARPG
jgi:ubiquinone/menaquinone biosynthesis C-methylase UbiE